MPRFDGDRLWINKRPVETYDLAPIHLRNARRYADASRSLNAVLEG